MTRSLLSGLGVSSLGWEPTEDLEIAHLLQSREISFIDLVPTKYFAWDDPAAEKKALEIRECWAAFGIKIRAIQSLLFGVGPLNILHTQDWPKLMIHFERVFSIASVLGVNRAVLGSPNNRKRGPIEAAEAQSIAESFLRIISDQAREHKCVVLLEPNPEEYGCDFVTTTSEAIGLVQKVNHENLMTQLDLGTCFYTNEPAHEILQASGSNIGYIHLATKNLQPLQDYPNSQINKVLGIMPEGQAISIEMKSQIGANNFQRVRGALDWVEQTTRFPNSHVGL